MLSLSIAEDYVTLKSFKQHQLFMMGRSEVILTILYENIHDEQVDLHGISVLSILMINYIMISYCPMIFVGFRRKLSSC